MLTALQTTPVDASAAEAIAIACASPEGQAALQRIRARRERDNLPDWLVTIEWGAEVARELAERLDAAINAGEVSPANTPAVAALRARVRRSATFRRRSADRWLRLFSI